jgi:hypothetical protein
MVSGAVNSPFALPQLTMRPPLAQPITLDFDEVWLLKTPRGRALLDVLSSGEISVLLAGKVDSSDSRLSDSRPPTVHGATAHGSTVEAVANKDQPSGYAAWMSPV